MMMLLDLIYQHIYFVSNYLATLRYEISLYCGMKEIIVSLFYDNTVEVLPLLVI